MLLLVRKLAKRSRAKLSLSAPLPLRVIVLPGCLSDTICLLVFFRSLAILEGRILAFACQHDCISITLPPRLLKSIEMHTAPFPQNYKVVKVQKHSNKNIKLRPNIAYKGEGHPMSILFSKRPCVFTASMLSQHQRLSCYTRGFATWTEASRA